MTHTAISASTLPYSLIQQSMTNYTIINTAIYSVTIIYMPQSKQQSMIWHSEYKNYRTITHEQGDRSPAAGGPPPMRIPGAARRTPDQLTKTLNFVLLYCFFTVFAICVIRYPHRRRPISREDAHLMYPRYPRVFLYVMIYCPLPHRSLWERLGVSLLCTCVAFSPLC